MKTMKARQMYSAIVTAAGQGTRFSVTEKKQFIQLAGKPLLYYSLNILDSLKEINEIVVTLPPDDMQYPQRIAKYLKTRCRIKFIEGGSTRQESVRNALNVCDEANEFVLIHDAARPFLCPKELHDMMAQAQIYSPLIPFNFVKNTLTKITPKQINTENTEHEIHQVTGTLSRDEIAEVYTPQIFRLSMIKALHQKAKEIDKSFTDDASICTYFDEPVYCYKTTSGRLKITTPDDLNYAEYAMRK